MHAKILLLLGILWAAGSALSANESIHFEELLGQSYGRELVQFDVPSGAPKEFAIKGANGVVPHQRSGNSMWFIADPVERYGSFQYELVAPTEAATKDTLRIKQNKDSLEISTGLLSARFPLGEGKGNPPPPLLNLRIGEGPWSEQGTWQTPPSIAGWSTQLQESGPVFAKVRISYTFKDDTFASFIATIIAGDSAIYWRMASSGDHPEAKAVFNLPALPGVQTVQLPKGYGQWAKQDRKVPAASLVNETYQLSPQTSLLALFPNNPWQIQFDNGQRDMRLFSRAPGDWVTPIAEQTYYGQEKWSLPMIESMWAGWRACGMPVNYHRDGGIELIAPCSRGVREWAISFGEPRIGRELEAVLAMTLEWPEDDQHPLLFMDQEAIDRAKPRIANIPRGADWAAKVLPVQTNAPLAEAAPAIDQLSKQLELLGEFDVMRKAIGTAGLYDALVDSPWLSPEQRQRFRAQMAYLAYLLADPKCWSSERGYGSGNPNMHCSYILSLGIAACVLRDHPMSAQWADYASKWMDHWLDHEVDANGAWIPEGSHYGNVSLEALVAYAIAAQRAGHRDFTNDPRLKKLLHFFAQQYTPPSPTNNNARVTGNYGRGVSSERLSTLGLAARMTQHSDPEFSAQMQWAWAQTGFDMGLGDYRLGGFRFLYLDPGLPQKKPEWTSEQFPEFGAVFRAGFGSETESFVNFLAGVQSERNLDIWTPSVTDIAQWYALGKPISSCFTLTNGTSDRHELLSEGVQLARNYQRGESGLPFGYYSTTDFTHFATLPGMDYARTVKTNTKPDNRNWMPRALPDYPPMKAAQGDTLTVDRQVVFMREEGDSSGPAYLVIRDTASGGQPTAWQFWTLTNGLHASDDPASYELAQDQKAPATKLADSDRYTAKGQYGIDMEYFIAAPSDTPRYTLRYGGNNDTFRDQTQWQDLLHLQRPKDGAYFIALYPHTRKDQAPQFSTNRDQNVIHVDDEHGSDFIFLNDQLTRASLNEAQFYGTAGSIKQRGNDHHLSLGAAGTASIGKLELEAEFPAAVSISEGRLVIKVPTNALGGDLRLTAPGTWSGVKTPGAPASFKDSLELSLSPGEHHLIYEKR
ncbi:hypothetical protein [Cerasicoccus fimbriatus]|uniref:hypothetical protein n=1 Tax=Cerasicoccus fimbriatus TaxID=3014554 RepID=UPI0022B44C92|nr:hypothetical protein [Cerasicoccus sp. TK19100]